MVMTRGAEASFAGSLPTMVAICLQERQEDGLGNAFSFLDGLVKEPKVAKLNIDMPFIARIIIVICINDTHPVRHL